MSPYYVLHLIRQSVCFPVPAPNYWRFQLNAVEEQRIVGR